MVAGNVANLATQSSEISALLQGRDTRWYKGHFAKLNLVLVSYVIPLFIVIGFLRVVVDTSSVLTFDHLHDKRI
jgi:hypothetical protein